MSEAVITEPKVVEKTGDTSEVGSVVAETTDRRGGREASPIPTDLKLGVNHLRELLDQMGNPGYFHVYFGDVDEGINPVDETHLKDFERSIRDKIGFGYNLRIRLVNSQDLDFPTYLAVYKPNRRAEFDVALISYVPATEDEFNQQQATLEQNAVLEETEANLAQKLQDLKAEFGVIGGDGKQYATKERLAKEIEVGEERSGIDIDKVMERVLQARFDIWVDHFERLKPGSSFVDTALLAYNLLKAELDKNATTSLNKKLEYWAIFGKNVNRDHPLITALSRDIDDKAPTKLIDIVKKYVQETQRKSETDRLKSQTEDGLVEVLNRIKKDLGRRRDFSQDSGTDLLSEKLESLFGTPVATIAVAKEKLKELAEVLNAGANVADQENIREAQREILLAQEKQLRTVANDFGWSFDPIKDQDQAKGALSELIRQKEKLTGKNRFVTLVKRVASTLIDPNTQAAIGRWSLQTLRQIKDQFLDSTNPDSYNSLTRAINSNLPVRVIDEDVEMALAEWKRKKISSQYGGTDQQKIDVAKRAIELAKQREKDVLASNPLMSIRNDLFAYLDEQHVSQEARTEVFGKNWRQVSDFVSEVIDSRITNLDNINSERTAINTALGATNPQLIVRWETGEVPTDRDLLDEIRRLSDPTKMRSLEEKIRRASTGQLPSFSKP